jgi:uncharacterized protein YkwD
LLLLGCEATTKRPELINPNQDLVCESTGAIQQNMVKFVNNVREGEHRCGNLTFSPAGPVRWNPKLEMAALDHARDMAQNDELSHTGSDGSKVDVRIQKAGYRWRVLAENISAGHQDSEDVVSSWLDSPDHCANLMDPIVTEIGAACFRNPKSTYGTYWALLMAAPRE